jgi:tRNA threonylcarbamoyladenosine biosynthesis protein TsaE
MENPTVGSRLLLDETATEALGAELARLTPHGGTWLLRGELGAGKTTWTRGFVAGMAGDPEQVASPTYAVLHRYETAQGRVFHLDLYRLGEAGGWSLGLEDIVGVSDFLVVEWAGDSGPWPTEWVATLSLEPLGDGRLAQWKVPG